MLPRGRETICLQSLAYVQYRLYRARTRPQDLFLGVSSQTHQQAAGRAGRLGSAQATKVQAIPKASLTLLVLLTQSMGSSLAKRRSVRRNSSTWGEANAKASSLIGALLASSAMIGCLAHNGHSTVRYGDHAANAQY